MKALHSQHVEVSKISSVSWERWTSSTYGTSQPYPHPPLCRPVIVGRLNSSRKPQCWTWGLVPPRGMGRREEAAVWIMEIWIDLKRDPLQKSGAQRKARETRWKDDGRWCEHGHLNSLTRSCCVLEKRNPFAWWGSVSRGQINSAVD